MFPAKPGALWRSAKRTLAPLERASAALRAGLFGTTGRLCSLGRSGGVSSWCARRWHVVGQDCAMALLLKPNGVLAEAHERLGKLDGIHGWLFGRCTYVTKTCGDKT